MHKTAIKNDWKTKSSELPFLLSYKTTFFHQSVIIFNLLTNRSNHNGTSKNCRLNTKPLSSLFFCFRLFIVATDCPSGLNPPPPPPRLLVATGDSSRIQDKTADSLTLSQTSSGFYVPAGEVL